MAHRELSPLIGAASELVYQEACRDPIAVCRTLARALKIQTAGAKITAVRSLADALDVKVRLL